MMLALGLYRLTRAIKNPHPDARSRHNWLMRSIWQRGDLFRVSRVRDHGILAGTSLGTKWRALSSAEPFVEGLVLLALAPSDIRDRIVRAELVPALERIVEKKSSASAKKVIRAGKKKS